MRKPFFLIGCLLLCFAGVARAGLLDNITKDIKLPAAGRGGSSDDATVVAGLKEALSVGTENAVKNVSRVDGYFGNKMIKILMPEKIQNVAEVLRKVGYQKEVDEFVLSMNRAAERAAPKAASIFGDAVRQMTFEDARKILNGGDTSATDFFKSKTSDRLYESFKPIISKSMNEVGVTRSYKAMMSRYESVPFVSKETVDLDHHVTNKSLDGLFYMVGQEEKKIRTDPAARVTDLLKTVFGK